MDPAYHPFGKPHKHHRRRSRTDWRAVNAATSYGMRIDEITDRALARREFATCPACCGPGEQLGALGAKLWFRCRDCGMEFYSHGRHYE